jgi:hypothetical protein
MQTDIHTLVFEDSNSIDTLLRVRCRITDKAKLGTPVEAL